MTLTWPNTMTFCPKCGVYYCGAHSCMGQLTVYTWPTPNATGWVCPVCGTGCSPSLVTHCDKPRSAETPAKRTAKKAAAKRPAAKRTKSPQ